MVTHKNNKIHLLKVCYGRNYRSFKWLQIKIIKFIPFVKNIFWYKLSVIEMVTDKNNKIHLLQVFEGEKIGVITITFRNIFLNLFIANESETLQKCHFISVYKLICFSYHLRNSVQ